MDCVDLVELYRLLMNMSLAMIPIAVFAGGLIGYVIGKIVERKRIMKEMQTLEDEGE